MPTQTLKDVAAEVIKKLPPTASLEEIMYQINLVAKALKGLDDKEKGNVSSTEELLKRMDQW